LAAREHVLQSPLRYDWSTCSEDQTNEITEKMLHYYVRTRQQSSAGVG